MSRKRRSYMPGMVFHVTSRTNGKEHWFDEQVRSEIVSIFATCFRQSDAQLLAYVVMTNHFHLIVRQGATSLGRILQSINCRIALMVQRHLGRTGHIFERRYWERPCADPDYLRDVIVYTHLNPVRAGLCSDPGEYRWTSHHSYARLPIRAFSAHALKPELTPVLELFTDNGRHTKVRSQFGYQRFLKWRQHCDSLSEDVTRPRAPECVEGDAYWALYFGMATASPPASAAEQHRPDLRDLVRQSLREMSPALTLEHLRLRCGGAMIVSARRTIIKRAAIAGFHGADIARYLNVSETTVSRVATSLLPHTMSNPINVQDHSLMRNTAKAQG
jgi:REP element-mobilizing transposase RayT